MVDKEETFNYNTEAQRNQGNLTIHNAEVEDNCLLSEDPIEKECKQFIDLCASIMHEECRKKLEKAGWNEEVALLQRKRVMARIQKLKKEKADNSDDLNDLIHF